MKILKQAGFPLLILSLLLFTASERLGSWELPAYRLALAIMLLGGLLLVVSPFLGAKKAEEPVPPAAPQPERGGPGPEALPGEGLEDPVPYGAGGAKVPPWILAAGTVAALAGGVLWLNGPNGVSAYTLATFGMMVGGPLAMLGAHFFYSGAAGRRNFLRGALAVFSFFVLFAGIMSGVLAAAGAFDGGWRSPWVAAGAAAVLLGCCGAYYGLRYQQSREGLYVAGKLGFAEASGGGEDSYYDARGVVNGVETLFDVTQNYPYKRQPASFRLEVLCRCGNRAGLRLSVKPEVLLGISVSGLPRAEAVPSWDGFDVRSDAPEAALRLLAGFRKPGSVFNGRQGFEAMALEGGDFKFVFADEGYIGPAYVRLVLDEASRLAALFR